MSKGPCAFCGEPVSPRNWQALRQAVYAGGGGDAPLDLKPGERSILVHNICGLPPEVEVTFPERERNQVKVEQPRTVHYIDVGDLSPPDALVYVKRVADQLREDSDDPFHVHPVRYWR